MFTLEGELSVLIIDDDADLRSSIVSYLEDVGFTVYQASGGLQGIEQFRRHNTDLVFTDLMMPEVDGLTVVQEITRISPGVPVVVVSGNGSVSYAMEAVRKGAWDYITKPILEFSVLDEVIARVLERARVMKSEPGLGQLAGSIAHDFKNLLTCISGNLYLAQAKLDQSHESVAAIKRAEQGSLRANQLAEKLMQLSKRSDTSRKAAALPEAIEECLALCLAGRLIERSLEIPTDLPKAAMDEGELCQVLNNLIINAAQATPDGGKLSIVAAKALLEGENAIFLPPGRYLRIRITDTGCGVAPEILDRIFEPYFTTKEEGSGLGLASVKGIMERCKGSVEVDSEVGKGTSVLLTIPASRRKTDA
jgi:signal transduction histidine kinase